MNTTNLSENSPEAAGPQSSSGLWSAASRIRIDSKCLADLDVASRRAKAEKIVAILRDALGERLRTARCLDIGCGIGVIAAALDGVAGPVVGLEAEPLLLRLAPADLPRLAGDALRLPFGDRSFDLVICAQVYEHVADADQLAAEVCRVLRPGGACFFSGPNRLWPFEYHYRLPLIHWLPGRWHGRALALVGRGALPIVKLRSHDGLRRLWRRFAVHDYTLELLRHAERFPGAGTPSWVRHLPLPLLRALVVFVPNVNWVLIKSL